MRRKAETHYRVTVRGAKDFDHIYLPAKPFKRTLGERIGDATVDGFERLSDSPWINRLIIGFVIFAWGLFSGYLFFRFQ